MCVVELLHPRQMLISSLRIQYEQVDVQVVATKSSLPFFDWKALEEEHGGRLKVWTDAEEWQVSREVGGRLRLRR